MRPGRGGQAIVAVISLILASIGARNAHTEHKLRPKTLHILIKAAPVASSTIPLRAPHAIPPRCLAAPPVPAPAPPRVRDIAVQALRLDRRATPGQGLLHLHRVPSLIYD
jgi:hypothetical protein